MDHIFIVKAGLDIVATYDTENDARLFVDDRYNDYLKQKSIKCRLDKYKEEYNFDYSLYTDSEYLDKFLKDFLNDNKDITNEEFYNINSQCTNYTITKLTFGVPAKEETILQKYFYL